MNIRLLQSTEELHLYDRWIKRHPHGNLWQSVEWKTYQEALGRETRIYAEMNDDEIVTSALVIIDRTAGGLSTWNIARGPLGPESDERSAIGQLVDTVVYDAQRERCLSLYLSPHIPLAAARWPLHASRRHEQPEATRIIDLTQSEGNILAQMHPKGRYNIKVAQKNGVTVRESRDVDAYVALAKKTASRDGFTAASAKTYRTFLESLPDAFMLLAFAPHLNLPPSGEGDARRREGAVAGLIGVTWNGTGVYYYGASDYNHRALMAPYLIQWEAMKKCKAAGCTEYDLLGIAPPNSSVKHSWAGISDFKAKFGGSTVTYPPEQEITLRPMLKTMLRLKRKILG